MHLGLCQYLRAKRKQDCLENCKAPDSLWLESLSDSQSVRAEKLPLGVKKTRLSVVSAYKKCQFISSLSIYNKFINKEDAFLKILSIHKNINLYMGLKMEKKAAW